MKKLISLITTLVILLSCAATAFASGGKVTYVQNAKSFIFEKGSEYSPTDLFDNFKGVMPGDTLLQKITVKNDASNNVKVKIFLRSLGAQDSSKEFLSQLGLRVKKSEDNDMAYMFDAAADKTAGLTDWVCLGTLYSGGEVNLDVLLDVPVELDNSFQSKIGYLDWEFMAQEFPVEESDPKPPQTNDNSNLGLWIIITVCCAVILTIFIILQQKEQERTKKRAGTNKEKTV